MTRFGAFDFTGALQDSHIVAAVIARNAPVGDGKWENRDRETIAEVAAAPGVSVHHYRTIQNRALLWMLTAFALAFPLGVSLQYALGLPGPNDPETMGYLAAPLALLAGYGWLCYFRSRIVWDSEAITQYSLFGRRNVRWSEVAAFRKASGNERDAGFSVGKIASRTTVLRFGANISGLEALQTEIERHAPPD